MGSAPAVADWNVGMGFGPLFWNRGRSHELTQGTRPQAVSNYTRFIFPRLDPDLSPFYLQNVHEGEELCESRQRQGKASFYFRKTKNSNKYMTL